MSVFNKISSVENVVFLTFCGGKFYYLEVFHKRRPNYVRCNIFDPLTSYPLTLSVCVWGGGSYDFIKVNFAQDYLIII